MKMSGVVFGSLLVCCVFLLADCQHPPPRTSTCTAQDRTECTMSPPFMQVSISEDNTYRNVRTNTCPVYSSEWTNPNQACEFEETYRIPLVPVNARVPIPVGEVQSIFEGITYLREEPAPIFGVLGVLVTGVNIFGVGSPCGASSRCPDQGAPTQYVDAVVSEGHTVDNCGGHASPMNEYHIHSGIGINTTSGREACRLPTDTPGEHSVLLGWMFDGYGIYGRYSLNGEVPTDLDTCGGHTHILDGEMTYHYHLPDGFPWIIGCFKGCPEVSNNPRQLSFANSEEYGCPVTYPTVETAPPTVDEFSGCVRVGQIYGLLTFALPVIMLLFI